MSTTKSPAKKPQTTTADPMLEREAAGRLVLALAQRQALHAAARDSLRDLHHGLAAYIDSVDRGDRWAWPDSASCPGSDPRSWRRLPRLAHLLATLDGIRHQLEWQLSTSPREPFWCPACSFEGRSPGRGWLSAECPEHDTSPSSAVSWGEALFGDDE